MQQWMRPYQSSLGKRLLRAGTRSSWSGAGPAASPWRRASCAAPATWTSRSSSRRMCTIINPAGRWSGAGIFTPEETRRRMQDVMPSGVKWIRGAVSTFQPDAKTVTLEDGSVVGYTKLVVAPGLKLDWDGVEGLAATLALRGSSRRGPCRRFTGKLCSRAASRWLSRRRDHGVTAARRRRSTSHNTRSARPSTAWRASRCRARLPKL